MTVDEEVGTALRKLAEDLRPLPDAYGRVRVRHRRLRRRRRTLTGLTVVVALLAAWVVSLPHSDATPRPAASMSAWDATKIWSQRLATSPPRGAVAQDPAFVRALATNVAERRKAGLYLQDFDVRAVDVLFVDDVGPYRIALVALDMRTPRFGWPYAMAWFQGPRGASAAELTGSKERIGYGDGLSPWESQQFGDTAAGTVSVAVAPASCTVETSAWPELSSWQPEPTGSYLVRTAQTRRPEWWRVTCDGRVREEQPAPIVTAPWSHSATDLAAQVRDARGQVTTEAAKDALAQIEGSGYELLGPGKVVWGGRLAWPGRPAGRTVVVAAPAVGGGWLGQAGLLYDSPDSQGSLGLGASFRTVSDPSRQDALVAVDLGDASGHEVLLIVPVGTASVRVLEGGGAGAAPVAVTGDAVVVHAQQPQTATYTALDSAGKEIARTTMPPPVPREGDFWSTP